MTTSRRDLLRFAALGAAAGTFSSFRPLRAMCGRSFAAQTNDKLVVIFLRGAMDAIYTVAPIGDPGYQSVRVNPPGIPSLPTPLASSPYLLGTSGFAALSDHFRILTQSNGPLANQHARFVLEVGNPNGLRSHFDEWEILERALQQSEFGLSEDGVYARLAKQAAFDPTLPLASIGPNLQRWFRSPDLVAAHIKSLQEYDLAHEDSFYEGVSIGSSMAGFANTVRTGMTTHYGQPAPATSPGKEAHGIGQFVLNSEPIVQAVPTTHDATLFPMSTSEVAALPTSEPALPAYASGFYLMKRCEEAIKVLESTTCSVVGIDVYDWDTHVNQAAQRDLTDPWLAKALHSLYLRALAMSTDPLNPRPTTVLVVTEFGRTERVNNNAGTDHGVGGIAMAFGTTVKGQVNLSNMAQSTWKSMGTTSPNPLWDNAMEVKTDFRTVMRELFRKRFALNTAQMAAVLPASPISGFDQSLDMFV
jgi:uncharacterized protein (DUF1501 family)